MSRLPPDIFEPLTGERRDDPFRETKAATSAAIQQVEENAAEEWKAEALMAVMWCAKRFPQFTADEVWDRLDSLGVSGPHTPSAIGPIFLQAKRAGAIERTNEWQQHSRFPRRHHALRLWRSTIPTPLVLT